MQYEFRRLTDWPGERTKFRTASKFKASLSGTQTLLDRELKHLSAKTVVIEADVDQGDIRLDGMLRSTARPRTPGIILSCDSRYGPLRFPCDRFHDWQDNLRAIALALEALRKVDRYGVTRRAEQYRGWEALPSPNGETWTKADALRFLRGVLGEPAYAETQGTVERMVRQAELRTHPDRGGNVDDFKKVQRARKLLIG